MKIACLLYGHFRNNEQLFVSHMNNIFKNNNCDIFIYTGKYYSNYFTSFPKMINKEEIKNKFYPYLKNLQIYEDNIEDMIECNNIINQRKNVFLEKNKNGFKDHERCLYWLYKLYKCNLLRKQYELTHNLNYDLVFTFRPDLEIIYPIDFYNDFENNYLVIDTIKYGVNKNGLHGIIDFFIFGVPDKMNIFCETIFNYYEFDSENINPKCKNPDFCYHPVDQILARFRHFGIKFISTNRNRPVRLMNNISHIPYNEQNIKSAIQVSGTISNFQNTKDFINKIAKYNDSDIFLCISKYYDSKILDKNLIKIMFENNRIRDIIFIEDVNDENFINKSSKSRQEYEKINNCNYNYVILINLDNDISRKEIFENNFKISSKLFNFEKYSNISNSIINFNNVIYVSSDFNINILTNEITMDNIPKKFNLRIKNL
jgi:hypothetical protein